VTRDWQPEDEHTDFSLLMHRMENAGDNFDVPAAGRMTLPQVRRLVAAATTYRDLEAVEREAFERANQARRDAMVLTETTNRRGEMVYQTRANSTNRTDRETLKIIAERRRELREQQRRPAAEAQVAAAPERGGDSGASAPAAPTAPAASAAAEFAKPSPSERAAAVAEGQEAEHEAAAGSPGGPEAAVAGEVVSGPEVKRGRTELDELKDALRELHDKYSDDPDRRNVELTNIQARVLALFDNPLYRSGGAEEDRRSEQLEFFEDYNRELTECNEQRRLEKEVTDVVLDLTLQLRGLFDQYKGDPRGMRENLPDFEEKARAARADLAKRVGTLQQKPTRTMTRLAAAYDLLYRRVTEIARQPNAKRAVRPPQSPPGEIES
jgi:hypothetical protein